MKAVIFGASGQDGRYLTSECNRKGIDVIPYSRTFNGLFGDIGNFINVNKIINEHKPDYVFHLAANSTIKHEAIFDNHQTISSGTINVLEAVKNHSPFTKVFITGSGIQFKNDGQNISDESEFQATSPYAVARIQSVYAARYYRTLGIKTYVGYLFNHESSYRKMDCVSQKVIHAVHRIKNGSFEKFEIGDITIEREWGFAGDIAKGILDLVHQDKISEAVIGTGKGYSIEDWIKACFKLINKDWKQYVAETPNFVGQYKRLVSNPDKIMSIGWEPQIDIDELAKIMLFECKIDL
jgi:GDPmannose 4,6-dehydratase